VTRGGGASFEVRILVDGPVPFERAVFLDPLGGRAFSWATAALTEDGGEGCRLVPVTPGELTRFLDVEVVP
jgi:hypothetical protein